MKDENLRVPLHPKYVELLQKMVRVAERAGSMTVEVDHCQSAQRGGTFQFRIAGTYGDGPEDIETAEEILDCVPGNPLLDFYARGYVLEKDGMYVVLNYELAKQRARYETRRKLGKWWMRATNDWGRLMLDLAAVLGGAWALVSIAIAIIEAL